MDQNNSMTFVSNEISSTILQKLHEQRKTNRFCDITLHVNNKLIRAHRNVLASHSPYFDSILQQHVVLREQLVINCSDADIFNQLIDFMYTGEIVIDYSNIEALLVLSDHFIMNKIIDFCIEFLRAKLNVETCVFIFFLTRRFKLKELNDLAEKWICSNLKAICESDEVLTIKLNEMESFLNNQSYRLSAHRVLEIASKWVQKDFEAREKLYGKLLSTFSWNDFDPSDVFKHLENCGLYIKSEFCLYQILNCLLSNNWVLSNYKTKYDLLRIQFEQVSSNDNKDPEQNNKSNDCDETNNKNIIVKTRQRTRKQFLLKRLMLMGLQPSLRMAALKMLMCKKKKISLCDLTKDEDDDDDDERGGIKCPICLVKINDSLLFEQHLALSHSKDVTYKCSICAFVCQYHGDYLNHMKTHFTGPPFQCDYCEVNYDQIAKLISHRAQHLEESVYQCSFCSFKCRLKQNFLAHLKMHTPEKTYDCTSCSKSFRFKHNLETHMSIHSSSEKNLSCETCGFTTKYLSHMIAHKRIHAASDVYRCSFPHCKYSTSKKNQLLSHAKTHNGVRPHSCGICGRGFMEKSHLVRHERIHLEEKPFKCSSCDYASSRRDKLKEHFTRHHGENASAKVPYKARPLRNSNSRLKEPSTSSTTQNGINFTSSNQTATSNGTPAVSNEIQDLIMHHQTHPPTGSNISGLNGSNYSHFGDPNDFHHHAHTHNLQQQILASGHNQRAGQHHNNVVNHHMLSRSNHPTATSTAAAVAAAMMLDPRFHHNTSVPYHPPSTSVSMTMASQQIPSSSQHSEYPPSIQNCMTLF